MVETDEVSSCSSSNRFYTSPNSPTHYTQDFDLVGCNDAAALFLAQEGQSLPKLGTWNLNDLASTKDFTANFEKEKSVKKTDGRSNFSVKDANSFKHDQAPKVAPIETEYFAMLTKSKTSPHNRKVDVLKKIFRLGGLPRLWGVKKQPLALAISTGDQPLPNEKNPISAEKKTDGKSDSPDDHPLPTENNPVSSEKKTDGKSNSPDKDENSNFNQGTNVGKYQPLSSRSKNSGKLGTFGKIFRLEGIRKLWRGKKAPLALPEPNVSSSFDVIKDGQPPSPVVGEQDVNDSTSDEIVNMERNEKKVGTKSDADENSFRKGSNAGCQSVLSHSNSVKRLESKLSSHSQHDPNNQLVTHVSKKYKGKMGFLYKIIKPGRFVKFWKGANSALAEETVQEDEPVPKFEAFGENGPATIKNELSDVFEIVRTVRKDEDRNDSTELVTVRSDRGSKEWTRSERRSTELRLDISNSMMANFLL